MTTLLFQTTHIAMFSISRLTFFHRVSGATSTQVQDQWLWEPNVGWVRATKDNCWLTPFGMGEPPRWMELPAEWSNQ